MHCIYNGGDEATRCLRMDLDEVGCEAQTMDNVLAVGRREGRNPASRHNGRPVATDDGEEGGLADRDGQGGTSLKMRDHFRDCAIFLAGTEQA